MVNILNMRYFILLLVLLASGHSHAQIGVYQTLESFIDESFEGEVSNETLWLDNDTRETLSKTLDRKYRGLRVRYFRSGSRTAWVLNEIGKERPITTGIVIENDKVVSIAVLEYRESRGGEVRLPSFRRQYVDAQLTKKNKLNKPIHGITGATLSVKTLKRSAIAALQLHGLVVQNESIVEEQKEVSLR